MKFNVVCAVLLVVVGAAIAQLDCSTKEAQCIQQCGGYDKMDFDCEAKRGAISSSCVCASVSQPIYVEEDGKEQAEIDVDDWCFDIESPGYDCETQKEWGKCNTSWMILNGYCRKTCFGCKCEDVTSPKSPFTCEQEYKWGKCNTTWMKLGRYCEKTCGRCGVPPLEYN